MASRSIATGEFRRAREQRNGLDVQRVREDFPILQQQIHGKPLVYLDNAASTQKPRAVLEAITRFYSTTNANVHRGVHSLSQEATRGFEEVRGKVARFVGAAESREIVFVRGATEAINLVAQSYGRPQVEPGDEILVSLMEHHSNIVPWQVLCESAGAVLRVVPISDDGELRMEEYARLLGPRTRLVAVSHVSNSLGTVNPLREVIDLAHAQGVPVLVDGAQAVPHMKVDVTELGCDFYCFSSHKMFGPTGVGVLYGRAELLKSMPPYQSGGDMIRSVSFEGTTFNVIPHKFEAGTPNIAGVIGMGAAIDYLAELGFERIVPYESGLLGYATALLKEIPGVRLIGTAAEKVGVLSFVLSSVHPHDIGTILDLEGVCVRTGHHCAEPVMHRFGVPATARVSLAFYNTREELDVLARGLHKVRKIFG